MVTVRHATLTSELGAGEKISDTEWDAAHEVTDLAAGDVSGLATIATSGSASDLSAGTVPAARMPALTGDVTTSAGTIATTLATVNGNVGTFGSATQAAQVTVNAKGLVTAVSNVTIAPAASSVTNGAALTKTDDTNVTATLGGSASSALLAAASITLGWTGTLAVARGGTGGGAASGTLLDNISGFASTGQIVRTGAGAYAFRTLTAPAAGITVTNGSGVGGNPTLVLANDLAALEALSGTNTIYYRSAADTWTAVTIGGSLSFSAGTLALNLANANTWSAIQTFSSGITINSQTLDGLSAAGLAMAEAADAQAQRVLLRNACMVKKSGNTTGINATAAAHLIVWDSEVYDDGGWHDNVTNNTRLTVPSGVTRVRVGFHVALVAGSYTANSPVFVGIQKNGTDAFDGSVSLMSGGNLTFARSSASSGPIPVTAGDYFECALFMGGDTSVDIAAAQSNFWIEAC